MKQGDYKKIGIDLLEECKKHFIGSQYIKPKEREYKVLQLHGNLFLRFKEWGNKPFYLILYRGSKYLFELELIKVLKKDDHYTWYLSKPNNSKNVAVLDRLLSWNDEVDQDYREKIKKIKETMGAGIVVYKNGYSLLEQGTWQDLSKNFLEVLDAVVSEHLGAELETTVTNKYDIDDVEAIEGYKFDKAYLQTQRNRSIVEERKRKDNFSCQVCNFKLKVNGKFIIECHHLVPIGGGTIRITNIDDLICLCPTCHRIVHTHNPPYSIQEMKNIVPKIIISRG